MASSNTTELNMSAYAKKAKLDEKFISVNPVNIDKYSGIDDKNIIIQLKKNTESDENYEDTFPPECMACCKSINDIELYEVTTPCLVSPKLKYQEYKCEKIRWEEIAFPLCKDHVHLVNVMKRRQDYPIGWDNWDILDSLSLILCDLVNDKE